MAITSLHNMPWVFRMVAYKNEAARIQLTDNGMVNFVCKILVMLEDPDYRLSVLKVAFVMDDEDVTCIRSTNSQCAVPSIPGRIAGGEDGPREEQHVAQRMCVCDVPSHCVGHLSGVECDRRSEQLRKLAI